MVASPPSTTTLRLLPGRARRSGSRLLLLRCPRPPSAHHLGQLPHPVGALNGMVLGDGREGLVGDAPHQQDLGRRQVLIHPTLEFEAGVAKVSRRPFAEGVPVERDEQVRDELSHIDPFLVSILSAVTLCRRIVSSSFGAILGILAAVVEVHPPPRVLRPRLYRCVRLLDPATQLSVGIASEPAVRLALDGVEPGGQVAQAAGHVLRYQRRWYRRASGPCRKDTRRWWIL